MNKKQSLEDKNQSKRKS